MASQESCQRCVIAVFDPAHRPTSIDGLLCRPMYANVEGVITVSLRR